MKNRIIDLLAQGLKPSQVANIVGCTPAYITQLSKQEDIAQQISQKREELPPTLDEDKALTNKYMATEHAILKQIEENVGMAEFRDLTRALEVIGNRQEKRLTRLTPQAAPNQGPVFNVLNLTLPAHVAVSVPSYQLNESKEIIAIGENTMTPLSTEGVQQLFASASGRNRLAVQDTSNIIEAPSDF